MNRSEFSCEKSVSGPAWGHCLWEGSDLRADSMHTHGSVTWFYPCLCISDGKHPLNLTRQAEDRSCYRRAPSLPWHTRAEKQPWVWSRPCQQEFRHHHQPHSRTPNVLRHCSRDWFCSPCFYFRFDTVTMITVTNIPQKLPGDFEHGVSSPPCSPILHWRHKMTVRTAGIFLSSGWSVQWLKIPTGNTAIA